MNAIRLIDVDRIDDRIPGSPRRRYTFADTLYPRAVQYAKKSGSLGMMFCDPEDDPGMDLPTLCILKDIDGSKLLCYRADQPVVKTQAEAVKTFRALREEAEKVDYPLILFYEAAALAENGGLPFLRGLADGAPDVQFTESADYFREIAGAMVDLPLVKLDPDMPTPDSHFPHRTQPQIDMDGKLTILPAENILYGPELPYTLSAKNVRPLFASGIQMTEGRTQLLLTETEGRETQCDVVCEAQDFAFTALFEPYELKVFTVDTATGRVTETDLTDVPE